MTTIEQIHSDFDTAVEILTEISDERQRKANAIEIPQEEKDYQDGVYLKNLGFEKTELAKKVDKFNSFASEVKQKKNSNFKISDSIREVVQFYQNIFLFHKFILYSQVIKICEKYNLYLSPAQFYNGEIPQKNIEEMKNFPLEKWNGNIYESRRASMNLSKPICEQIPSSMKSGPARMYICAPLNEFDMEGNTSVGREIYQKGNRDKAGILEFKLPKKEKLPKDPIILLPVQVSPLMELGFIVVTKWGEEANDLALQVGINN